MGNRPSWRAMSSAFARNTVKIKGAVTGADFDIKTPSNAPEVRVRVIGVIENQAPTRALTRKLAVEPKQRAIMR